MAKENQVVITLVLDKKLKISLQECAPSSNLLQGRRGASGLILTILSKFKKEDGTLDKQALDHFLNSN